MKWWFSDYDGTINLTYDDVIDPRDRSFINDWISSGNEFGIASGRMFKETSAVLKKEKIAHQYIVACNGATIYKANGEKVYQKSLDMSYRKKLIDVLSKYKGIIQLGLCVNDERISWNTVKIPSIESNPFFKGYHPDVTQDAYAEDIIMNNKDLNLIYIYDEESKLADRILEIRKALPEISILRTNSNVGEIMHKGVSKGNAIKELATAHKIDFKDIYVSGDGENDIAMLKAFPNSFAMREAQNGVHAAANNIIGNVFEIANYID